MIWAIASIPFWAIAATAAVVAAACTWIGLHASMYERGVASGKLDKPRHEYFLIGVGFWLVSSAFTLIAAKICS